MTEKTASPIYEVSARIDKWQEGPYGFFGFAKVLSADPPAAEAIYFASAAKALPELGEPFDCSISVVKDRWRVIALASEREPVEQELSGIVLSCCGNGMKRSWRIELNAPTDEARFATLTTQVLNQAKVAHLEHGQPLSFMALLPPEGDWSVTKVLTPLAAEAITDHASNCAIFALALTNWTTDTDKKSLAFAVNSPPSKVWPLVYVPTSLLFKQSIRTIHPADAIDASAIASAKPRVIEMAREYSVQPVQVLICAGFAGNTKTASLIIRTGKTLGRHFDLLDDVQATVLFKVFFGQALIELDQQLMAAVKVIQSGIRG